MGFLYSESGRQLACDKCSKSDFAVEGRQFDLALICPECALVICSSCSGRDYSGEGKIGILCCFRCRSSGLRDAVNWADRLAWRGGFGEFLLRRSIDGPA